MRTRHLQDRPLRIPRRTMLLGLAGLLTGCSRPVNFEHETHHVEHTESYEYDRYRIGATEPSSRRVSATLGPHDQEIEARVLLVDPSGRELSRFFAPLGQDGDGHLCDDQRIDELSRSHGAVLRACPRCAQEPFIGLRDWICCGHVFGEHGHSMPTRTIDVVLEQSRRPRCLSSLRMVEIVA